jgi:hypothetical protein
MLFSEAAIFPAFFGFSSFRAFVIARFPASSVEGWPWCSGNVALRQRNVGRSAQPFRMVRTCGLRRPFPAF